MEIRKATLDDIKRYKIRKDDAKNFISAGYTPESGLLASIKLSDYCWVAEDKGEIFCISGVAKAEYGGTIWIMFADKIDSPPLSFFKQSKKYVKFMLDRYGYLENFARADKAFIMNWGRMMGFTVDPPIEYEENLFCRVHIEGE